MVSFTNANFINCKLLIALAIATLLSVSTFRRLTKPNLAPKQLTKLKPSKEYLKKVREEAWPYVPADLSDEDFVTLLSRLQKASNQTKYIFRFKTMKDRIVEPIRWCGSCEFTYDPVMIDHPETKAIIVDYDRFNKINSPSLRRRPDQLYIWLSLESPDALRVSRHMTLEEETAFKFNLTQTYRRDSGIYKPYRRISDILQDKQERGIHTNLTTILRTKTKLVASVISNCYSTSGAKTRLRIIKRMKSLGLDVDTFGRCFNKPILERGDEFDNILGKYKFYLSFENAFHCRDYITEKFLRYGHKAGTVPIVLGATKSEYEAVAPRGSFIFVEDFESMSDLVEYLKYLDQNDEEYLKYFRWITEGPNFLPEPRGAFQFCRLCRILHGINIDDTFDPNYNKTAPPRALFTNGIASRTVQDLKYWFYGNENNDCFKDIVLPIMKML